MFRSWSPRVRPRNTRRARPALRSSEHIAHVGAVTGQATKRARDGYDVTKPMVAGDHRGGIVVMPVDDWVPASGVGERPVDERDRWLLCGHEVPALTVSLVSPPLATGQTKDRGASCSVTAAHPTRIWMPIPDGVVTAGVDAGGRAPLLPVRLPTAMSRNSTGWSPSGSTKVAGSYMGVPDAAKLWSPPL